MRRYPLIYYDELNIYTNNHNQDNVRDLVNRFKKTPIKLATTLYMLNSTDDMLDTGKYHFLMDNNTI